ncbi:L-rhamnose isomerase, partial [Klebsiella pneumoniae]|uniref:L-rhamnose isomerase n=1 Tax=Klebsiella pneumoniae TaxID=573 RepID=UPI0021750623
IFFPTLHTHLPPPPPASSASFYFFKTQLFDVVHTVLDFLAPSLNRVAAWVIATHNMHKALLRALLEPTDQLRQLEASGDYTASLALLEEQKSLTWQAVWDGRLYTARSPRDGTRQRKADDACKKKER